MNPPNTGRRKRQSQPKAKRMMDSLWGHPEHQGGEEHRHHTKKERDLLPGPNNLGGLPRRREFRQPLLNLHNPQRDVVGHHTFVNEIAAFHVRLLPTLSLNFCISRSKFSAKSSPAGVFILFIASSARILRRSPCFVSVRWIKSIRASKKVSTVSTKCVRPNESQ